MPTERFSESRFWLAGLLQTSDALFPTGAYAHSFGLEEMIRLREVFDEESLRDFLGGHLLPVLETQDLPYLRFAFQHAKNLPELCAIDREIHASKLARETREASIQIGTRRIKALQAISEAPELIAFATAIHSGDAFGHHLCAFAIQGVSENIPIDALLMTYAYQTLSGAVAAALKLIRIGQDGCQRALRHALGFLPEVIETSLSVERDQAGCFSPLLEIASMRHAFAQERLFIS